MNKTLKTTLQASPKPITIFTYLVSISLLLLSTFGFSQNIVLSPQSGPPTSKVLVSGSDFPRHVALDIYFDTKDKALAVTDGSGSFSNIAVKTPKAAVPGKHWITAVARHVGTSAQAPFTIRTDWSMLHFSPDHKGVNPYENVLNTSTVGGLDLLWSFPTGDNMCASPTVVGRTVYVGSWDSNMYALNTATGAQRWKYTTNAQICSTAAVAGGVVYFGGYDAIFYALHANTGAKLWSYAVLGVGIFPSPVVVNGTVYFAAGDGYVYALNAKTGTKLWSYNTGSDILSSPAVVNKTLYIGTFNGSFLALNATTGALVWEYVVGATVWGPPAVANGVVYFGATDHKIYALNSSTGAKLWSYTTGDVLVSVPAVANGMVYASSEDHNVYALDASTGALVWKYLTGDVMLGSPTVANGVLYVGSNDNNVYALDAKTGAKLWTYATAGVVQDIGGPTVADGVVYVTSGTIGGRNNVYAFSVPYGERLSRRTQRPNPKTLQPDYNLKFSQPVAKLPAGGE